MQEFDELEYARITNRHFGCEGEEYRATADDLVASIPIVAAAFEEPFGNSSAVPTYLCARHAHQNGLTRLLAGAGAVIVIVALIGMYIFRIKEQEAAGNLAKFKKEQERSLSLRKKSAPAFVDAARKAILAGDLKTAELNLSAALEFDAKLADAWFVKAQMRAGQKDFEGAVEDLDKAIALDPESESMKALRKHCLRANKDPDAATFSAIADILYKNGVPVLANDLMGESQRNSPNHGVNQWHLFNVPTAAPRSPIRPRSVKTADGLLQAV